MTRNKGYGIDDYLYHSNCMYVGVPKYAYRAHIELLSILRRRRCGGLKSRNNNSSTAVAAVEGAGNALTRHIACAEIDTGIVSSHS